MKQYDEKLLRKYRIDSTEKIYNSIKVDELKVNQYSTDTSLLGALPTFNRI